MAIPELQASRARQIDVDICYGSVASLPTEKEEAGQFAIEERPGIIHFWMNEIGGLEIRDGRELIVDPAPGAEARGFRFLVSGIGMGFVLHQRGIPSLHASAVALDGEAVAFMGWKGMGKSTTTAVFHAQGCPVLTDDLLPLYTEGEAVLAAPAFPGLKLLPEAVEAARSDRPDDHPLISRRGTKRIVSVREGFPAEKLPLRCVYVLEWQEDEGSPAVIEPMPPREACIELMRHSFALRMFEERGATPQHLAESARLARRLPVRRLRRPRDLARLHELVDVVKKDLEGVRRSDGVNAPDVVYGPG
ncbi:hypothetical protein [Rhodocaloribacter sp.]